MPVIFELSVLSAPIVQAPMAGGPSKPELAVAVCDAGGLGFLAGGFKRAEREEVAAVRARTARPGPRKRNGHSSRSRSRHG